MSLESRKLIEEFHEERVEEQREIGDENLSCCEDLFNYDCLDDLLDDYDLLDDPYACYNDLIDPYYAYGHSAYYNDPCDSDPYAYYNDLLYDDFFDDLETDFRFSV